MSAETQQSKAARRGTQVTIPVPLSNANLVFQFKRLYEDMDAHLYYITMLAPSVLRDAYPSGLRAQIDALITERLEALDKTFAFATDILTTNELPPGEPAGDEGLTASFRTPTAKRIIDLFIRCEETCRLVDTAWLHGHLTDTKHAETLSSIKRHINVVNTKIGTTYRNLMDIANKRKREGAKGDSESEGKPDAPGLTVVKAA